MARKQIHLKIHPDSLNPSRPNVTFNHLITGPSPAQSRSSQDIAASHNLPTEQRDRHGRPHHGPGLRAGPRAPPQAHHDRGHRHPPHRPLASHRQWRRRGRGGRAGRRGGRGEPGLGLLRGGRPRRARGDRGARYGGAARVLRAAARAEGRGAEERGGAARVLRVGAHQERQGLEGGVRPRPARAAAAGSRGRRRDRVPEQVAPGSAGLQRGAGGVYESHGGAGVQAAGADRPEPEAEARPAARLLQGPDHLHPAEPLPSVPQPRPGPRRGAAQGRRRPDHPVPGRRRRARRPAALRRRVGARQARAGLVHHQRRRPHPGVEQRQVRERGAPGVGELGEGEVLPALLLQPGELHHGGAGGGAGERGRPAQVQPLQLGRILQHQEEQQLQEAQRGEHPDRAFQEEPRPRLAR